MSLDTTPIWDLACRLGEQPMQTLRHAEQLGFEALLLPPDETVVADSPVTLLSLGEMTAGLGGEQLAEMGGAKRRGIAGVTQGYAPFANLRVQLNALRYAQSQHLRVHLLPLDPELGKGVAHDGHMAQRLGLETQPAAAETIALARDLQLVAETGVTAHFGRLSCAESVRMMARAKQDGLAVTCDVGIAHLLWTDEKLEGYDFNYRLQPVLRSERDRLALIEGLNAGVIDAVVSNHSPWPMADKMLPFAQSKPGTQTLALLLEGLKGLVEQGVLSEKRAVDALSVAPQRIAAG